MFLDYVDDRLTRVSQLDSPIRKILLSVVINDSVYYSRVDKWLEFIKQMNVEDLCIFVQMMVDSLSEQQQLRLRNALYEFPVSLFASKSLKSVYIRGCQFGHATFASEVTFSSLQRLCLSHVSLGENVVEILARSCQGIEILILDNCYVILKALELSRFPKLKKALIEIEDGWIDYVDIVNTNLECFKCNTGTKWRIGPDDCVGIREFTFVVWSVSLPNLFKDLTATFPLMEQAELQICDTKTLKAASNVLRKLKFVSHHPIYVEEVHIDCPGLTLLDFSTRGMTNLYVDCPKLRVFRYVGNTVPEQLFFKSTTELEESHCSINIRHAYDMSWFIKLRLFLDLIMGSSTNVSLLFIWPMVMVMVSTRFCRPLFTRSFISSFQFDVVAFFFYCWQKYYLWSFMSMGFIWFCKEKFKPEEVKPIRASPQYEVNLTLSLFNYRIQNNVAAHVDALLWIIRPTTFTVDYRSYYVVKYLCENLVKKSQDKICGAQIRYPCWLHQIEDFQVESSLDISDIKENLASFPEQCQAIANPGYHEAEV